MPSGACWSSTWIQARPCTSASADKLFAPASTTKLYSVAAALDELGADYRFETPVYARGELDKERLDGDLILVASGDLTMGGRSDDKGHIAFVDTDHTYANFSRAADITAPDPLLGLDDLARQVAAANIKHVAGNVLVDDRLFDTAQGTGSGPAHLTPIIVNDNVIDVKVTPTKAGQPAKIEWRPHTRAVRVDAHVDTVDAGGETRVVLASPGDGLVIVHGQIAADAKPIVRIYEVEDPASFARSLFIEALRRAGVRVDSSALEANDGDDLPDAEEYASLARGGATLAAVFRIGEADSQGQPQPARQHAPLAAGGQAWPAHTRRGAQAAA